MDERKVLVISYYFPPMGLSGVQRTVKFVKYLTQYGWDPVVLTSAETQFYAFDESLGDELPGDKVVVYRAGKKEDAAGRREEGKRDKGKGKREKEEGKRKFKIKRFPSYFFQKIGRAVLQTIYQPDSKRPWLKYALKKGDEIFAKHKITVIFATAPPFTDFLVALELSKKYNVPFIVDYRDVWIDNPFHFFATPFHKLYSIKLEKEILNRAEKAVVTTRHTKALILERNRFISHSDIEIVSHGFDPEDFESANQEFNEIKKEPGRFVITHSGLFQDNRTPKYFLKAVSIFFKKVPDASQNTELRFIGIMRKGHLRMIKKYGLQKNIILTGYLPHNEVIKHLLNSDILWLMQFDNVRSPGKLYEYFGARKPILACLPDGILKKQVEESEAGYVTNPKDVAGILQHLCKLYELYKTNKLPIPSENFVIQFDRKTLTGELSRILALASEI